MEPNSRNQSQEGDGAGLSDPGRRNFLKGLTVQALALAPGAALLGQMAQIPQQRTREESSELRGIPGRGSTSRTLRDSKGAGADPALRLPYDAEHHLQPLLQRS